jgi:Tol biopolymer transport system component
MKRSSIFLVLATLAVALASALPASATFPGKNGRIVFLSGNMPPVLGDIFTMNPDGSDVQQLTFFGPAAGADDPGWSADGRYIVFAFYPTGINGGPAQIWMMNGDGSNQHQVFQDVTGAGDYVPSFSPDGKLITFSRCTSRCLIYRVNTDGTGLAVLTTPVPDGGDFVSTYSPDGNTISFDSFSREGFLSAIWFLDADGTNLRRLTPGFLGANWTDWSPDGGKIVFQASFFFLNEEIWSINTDGSGLTQLTNNNQDWHGYYNSLHDILPVWSPDGKYIVFERLNEAFTSSSIVVMNADGSGVHQVHVLPGSPRMAPQPLMDWRNRSQKTSTELLRRINVGGSVPHWGTAPLQP